jgi:hypothetical protein
MVKTRLVAPAETRVAETVFGASGHYISELADNITEGNEKPPALSKNAIRAAALFCENAWERPAWAQKYCAQVA